MRQQHRGILAMLVPRLSPGDADIARGWLADAGIATGLLAGVRRQPDQGVGDGGDDAGKPAPPLKGGCAAVEIPR